jgi:hypothetical protein
VSFFFSPQSKWSWASEVESHNPINKSWKGTGCWKEHQAAHTTSFRHRWASADFTSNEWKCHQRIYIGYKLNRCLTFSKEAIRGWYEGESVNRSQNGYKMESCDIRTREKHFISRHILHQHWYNCPITLPMHQNPQHRSLLTIVSATSAPLFQPLRHQQNVYHVSWPSCEPLNRRTLPTVNNKHFLWISFALSPFAHKKTTIERCSSVLYSLGTVAIVTTNTSLWTCACGSTT